MAGLPTEHAELVFHSPLIFFLSKLAILAKVQQSVGGGRFEGAGVARRLHGLIV